MDLSFLFGHDNFRMDDEQGLGNARHKVNVCWPVGEDIKERQHSPGPLLRTRAADRFARGGACLICGRDHAYFHYI